MDTVNEFEFKRRKYMPVFAKARGKPTIYIPEYPYEDEEPMPASALFLPLFLNFYPTQQRIRIGLKKCTCI